MNELVWSIGEIKWTGQNWSTWCKTCPSATLSTTKFRWTVLVLTVGLHTEMLAIMHSHYSVIFTVGTWLSRVRVVNFCDMWFGLIYKIVVHTLSFPHKTFWMCLMPNFWHSIVHMLNCSVLLLTFLLSYCHCLICTHFIETVSVFFTNLGNFREMST